MQISYETTLILTVAACILMILGMLAFVAYIVKLYSLRQLEFKKNLSLLENEFQKQILKTRIEVQEEAINDVAKEIHDNVNQILSFSKLNLNLIDLSKHEILKEKIDYSSKLIGDAISSLSNISRSLNSDLLKELGLVKTLDIEIDKVNRIGNCIAQFEVTGTPINLPFETELVFFRVAQEAIRNSITHGKATQIKATLDYGPLITMKITDNGSGFDLQNVSLHKNELHQGLINMNKRAQLIGANLEINSTQLIGTTIYLTINNKTIVEEN